MIHNKYPITFIIPCYNCAKTIKESVMSIINLNLENYEICMVDDCSKDETLEIIKRLSKKYPDVIRFSSHSENMGGAVTRNDCVKLSNYPWIFCLDSDNVLHGKSFLKLYYEIKPEDTMISFGVIKYFFDFLFIDVVFKKWVFNSDVMDFTDLRKTMFNPPASGNLLFSRKLFDNIGGYETDLGAYDSYAFGYKALYYGNTIKIVRDAWYYHRLGLNSYWKRESSRNESNLKKLLLRFPDKFTSQELLDIKESTHSVDVFVNLPNDFTIVHDCFFSKVVSSGKKFFLYK